MKLFKVLALCLMGAALSGCSTILARDLHAEKKTLKIEVKNVEDPVGYSNGNVISVASPGYRFIGSWLGIENKTNQDLLVKLDKFVLAEKKEVGMTPSIIDMDMLIGTMEANPRPVLSPHERITRLLIFSFPIDNTPDRMLIPEVGEIVFPKREGE